MRIIDADALIKKAVVVNTDEECYSYILLEDVMDAPTIEERKTGRWVLVEMGDTDLYECSLCRKRKTYMSPFCDMCGANMEGAEE